MDIPNHQNYYAPKIIDINLPICIYRSEFKEQKSLFHNHWHKQLEFLYFVRGNALVQCNSKTYTVGPKDIVVVNSHELHYAESIGNDLLYYVIIVDMEFLHSSSVDTIETQYIAPLLQNHIVFNNVISKSDVLIECLESIILEYNNRDIGYELAIKYHFYHLLVILLRNHVEKQLTQKDYSKKLKQLNNITFILQYIESDYMKKLSTSILAEKINWTEAHFCRVFKSLTGRTPTDFIHQIRINKACDLLRESDMSITEIALETGFGDINYFSRLFKKYKNKSPLQWKNSFYYL